MGSEGGFIAIFFVNLRLPVSDITVQCRKYRPFKQWIETFVHTWYRLWVVNPYCVEFPIIVAESKRAIHFWYEHNRRRPFGFNTFNDFHGEHSSDSLFFKLSRNRASTVRSRVNGSVVRLVELDSVLRHDNWPRWPTHMPWNCSSTLANLSRNA